MAQEKLVEITDFGSNPGKLSFFVHPPKSANKEKVPLVIVLHGCSQSATEIAVETGWNTLADQNDFMVVYPEQKRGNNMSNCFNWFNKQDRDGNGESESIYAMIRYTMNHYPIDSSRVFIYGLSAGAAMTVNLMAQYPSLFNAGASLAGGAYGLADNGMQAMSAMMNPKEKSREDWGSLVETKNPAQTRYPRLLVFHGTKDNVVDFSNAQILIDQWTYVHKCDAQPAKSETNFAGNPNINRHEFSKGGNHPAVVFYEGLTIGHVLPVDPGSAHNQGGATGMYTKDLDFFSTYYIAQDFGILK